MVSKRRKDDDFAEWENSWKVSEWRQRDSEDDEPKTYKYSISEPMMDVREDDETVRIVIEASGSSESDVVIEKIRPHSVEITLKYRGRRLRKRVILPSKVKSDGYTVKVRNGVAQILLAKD